MYIDHNEESGTKLQVEAFTLSGTLISSTLFKASGGMETLNWQHGIVNPGAYIVRVAVQNHDYYKEESRLLIFSGSR